MEIVKTIKENIEKGEEKLKEIIKEGEEAVGEIVEEVEEKLGVKKNGGDKSSKKTKKKIEKEAESESTTGKKEIETKKMDLLERAKKLRKKIETTETEELKEKVKIKKQGMLVPLEEYVKAGIYLGTKVVTPDMKPFVYRRRADGLAIFNTDLINEKIREGIDFLSKFPPEDVILVCKREAGWKAVKKFGEVAGIRVFTKKYPAGILTNKNLPDFFENELTIITDHWIDRNALNDTLKVHKKILMICDTNNFSRKADKFILGNNKSSKSLGIIFYLLAKGYCEKRGIKAKIPELEWWTGEVEDDNDKDKKIKSREAIVAEAGIMSSDEGFGV